MGRLGEGRGLGPRDVRAQRAAFMLRVGYRVSPAVLLVPVPFLPPPPATVWWPAEREAGTWARVWRWLHRRTGSSHAGRRPPGPGAGTGVLGVGRAGLASSRPLLVEDCPWGAALTRRVDPFCRGCPSLPVSGEEGKFRNQSRPLHPHGTKVQASWPSAGVVALAWRLVLVWLGDEAATRSGRIHPLPSGLLCSPFVMTPSGTRDLPGCHLELHLSLPPKSCPFLMGPVLPIWPVCISSRSSLHHCHYGITSLDRSGPKLSPCLPSSASLHSRCTW